jgi:hypothetical protein
MWAQPSAEVRLRTVDGGFSKSRIWVERDNFYGRSQFDKGEPYLIVGYDTEFKTPDNPVTIDEVKEGNAKYTVLSYQVHCSVYDPSQPTAREWSAICYPENDERLTLSDVLNFAFWKGIDSGCVEKLPTRIYIVGHFTRADVPAFADFHDLTQQIAAVRSTFTSVDKGIKIIIGFNSGETVELLVMLRDTMLLTPASSKSLLELGKLVNVPKLTLDADPAKEKFYKENMDVLLRDKPDVFERYAINDAIICTKYLQQFIAICADVLGKRKAPATLTAIGVELLMNKWKGDLKFNPLDVVGKQKIKERYFSKRLGRYVTNWVEVHQEIVSFYLQLATECYHGGRGEQFWFGPAFEDDWTDYDLAGAYPTAMARIGYPDWSNIRQTTKLTDFTPDTLGVAHVHFSFPSSVRFPTMPVRSANGLIFPRSGVSNCSAPEIALARSLGAKLEIKQGVVVPMDASRPVFLDFIRDCTAKRRHHDKGTLYNLFWKEISNSSYGKTAQGLHAKRVYDLRDREMKPLPPSKITNPFFAAYITSFVRAALGEVMNGLPEGVCVFSCTTDGFLTNASASQIVSASTGPICQLFGQSRDLLTGDPTILEVKHRVRQPLGWRTRGQATLKEGVIDKGDGTNIVLAKGGIYTPAGYDSTRLQNEFIAKLFLDRSPNDRIKMATKTGVRDMVDYNADLVTKDLSKRLNMEFDWKRRPSAAWDATGPSHLAFATQPWDTIDQFIEMRRYWESFAIDTPRCLKTVGDYRAFAISVMSQSSLENGGSRYLKKTDPDLKRLRQSLCAAWRNSEAGLSKKVDRMTADKFAETLTAVGISCKRSDVENARSGFKAKNCPKTPAVLIALTKLLVVFPRMEIDTLVTSNDGIDIIAALDRPNPYSVNFEITEPIAAE